MARAIESTTALNLARRFLSLPAEKASRFADALRGEGIDPASLPIPATGVDVPRSCVASAAQQRLWFLWTLQPESAANTMVRVVRLKGTLSFRAIQGTFDALVERHEPLRTRFVFDGTQLMQQIEVAAPVKIQFIDLKCDGESVHAREARAKEAVGAEEAKPFDLHSGRLLRVALIGMGEDDHILVVCLSHAICDGWSMSILLDEFAALYNAEVSGTRAALAPLPIQYADFAVWQTRWLAAGELSRQLDYWKRRLADEAPPPALPLDRKCPADASEWGATFEIQIDAGLSAGLVALALQHRVTPFVLLMASFKVLLHRCSGARDVCVGMPIANRNRTETEPLIGFFVNMLVIRSDFSADSSFAQLLQAVALAVIEAQSCQDVPFDAVVDALNPPRSGARQPLFQVAHNHEIRKRDRAASLIGLAAEPFHYESRVTQFELLLFTQEWRDEDVTSLRAFLTYRADLFERASIERMAARWVRLLQSIVRSPEAAVSALSFMDEAERAEEELLAKIWSDVLGVEHIGRHDNFFELGGRSLLMASVLARMRKCGDRWARLTLVDLMEQPTIHGLVRYAGGVRAAVPLAHA